MLVGDSIAYTLGSGFPNETFDDELSVANESILGCSVARGRLAYSNIQMPMRKRCANWPRAWKEASARVQPDLVVILTGAWEVVDRIVGDTR